MQEPGNTASGLGLFKMVEPVSASREQVNCEFLKEMRGLRSPFRCHRVALSEFIDTKWSCVFDIDVRVGRAWK